jgi:hypothetical protein
MTPLSGMFCFDEALFPRLVPGKLGAMI